MTFRNKKIIRIVFCCGGTGGHVFPALALADGLKALVPKEILDILFIGTSHRIEATLVPKHGYRLETISPIGFLRNFSFNSILNNLVFPFKLWKSISHSKKILKRFKPHVMVGTGGFVSGPPLRAAHKLGIPTLLQEQNSHPGITTKIAGNWAQEIHTAYKMPQFGEKLRLSGNPLRSDLVISTPQTARKKLGLSEDKMTIGILGGSQGAAKLNEEIEIIIQELLEKFDLQIIWQTGKHNLNIAPNSRIVSRVFFDDMSTVYSALDLAIARAGALTISELFYFGVPAIFVPFRYATDNHQTQNAKSAVKNGAAIMVHENQLPKGALRKAIFCLQNNTDKLKKMKNAAQAQVKPYATKTICNAILKLSEQINVR